jgi:hypothetical protein
MTLNKVDDRLRGLAAVQQVLVITHWPQLAAQGDMHFQLSGPQGSGGRSHLYPLHGSGRGGQGRGTAADDRWLMESIAAFLTAVVNTLKTL